MPEQIETVNGNGTPDVEQELVVPPKSVPTEPGGLQEPPPQELQENGNRVDVSDTFVSAEKIAEETTGTFVSDEKTAKEPPKAATLQDLQENGNSVEVSGTFVSDEKTGKELPKAATLQDLQENGNSVEVSGTFVSDEKTIEETSGEEPPKAAALQDLQENGNPVEVSGVFVSEEKSAEEPPLPPKIVRAEPVGSETNHTEVHPIKKRALLTGLDIPSVKLAYEEVRSDGNDTQWAVFKFEGPQIKCSAKGSDFKQFQSQFSEDERAFGYIRVQTGDEMSKRQKFLLLTWVGPSVSVLKRAKMSTDKSLIKDIVSNFAIELQTENLADLDLDYFVAELNKAGGANYGTGIRES
ncbi:uncharacterized protein LOC132705165 isoform X2 [Cylas formicarius]|uniref:uncharacterized protein LOC132705165 isoform X2 n=1 Tax=Cylas formicarius TaxID=197179 RepID=UPI0029589361|nr:uncharacterized protein LOC132705165 isoform X2 [Cylas formicarius]